jgi:hypothetical protein
MIKHLIGFRTDRREAVFLFDGHVRYWHKADIPSCTAHVRFWGVKQTSVLFQRQNNRKPALSS